MEKYNGRAANYLQLTVCDKNVTTELSGDFTLPDYQPEIKRLLRVGASVLPPSKYIGEREAELAGNIDYYVVYTGSDNCVYCAPLSGEYKVNIPFEPMDAGEDTYIGNYTVSASTVADMISGRVTAPRKISVKCRLRTRSQIFGELPLEESVAAEDESIQTLFGVGETVRIASSVGEMLTLCDEMICDNREEDLRVVSAEGRVLINEINAATGEVNCRGDLYLKLLLCRDDGSSPYTVTRKLPLSQNIPLDGAEANSGISAKGTVCEMGITVEEGRIGINAGIVIEVEACCLENVRYVKDVYSTARRTENTYKKCAVQNAGTSLCSNFTLSDSSSIDEAGIATGAKVIDISGVAYPEEYDLESERCGVLGKAKFSLLLEKDGEYSTADIELPFSYKSQTAGKYGSAHFACEVISSRARADGERIGIDAEIAVIGNALATEEESILANVGFGEEIERSRGEFVICYPSPEDSLWSVAKRYGARLDTLAELNGIPAENSPDLPESVKKVKYLVI